MKKRICLNCEKEYPARSRGKKYCSRKCYQDWKKKHFQPKTKICLFCGTEFSLLGRGKKGNEIAKFCSKKCLSAYQAKNWKGENSPKWREKILKKCLTCGKKIFVLQSRLKDGRGKFCSHSCEAIYRAKRQKKKNTDIELKLKEILLSLNIKFEEQKVIPEGKTVADFYIPAQRLVLYADGLYWHSLPGVERKDHTQNFLLNFNGYEVLRFGDNDLLNQGLKVKRIIRKRLKALIPQNVEVGK